MALELADLSEDGLGVDQLDLELADGCHLRGAEGFSQLLGEI